MQAHKISFISRRMRITDMTHARLDIDSIHVHGDAAQHSWPKKFSQTAPLRSHAKPPCGTTVSFFTDT